MANGHGMERGQLLILSWNIGACAQQTTKETDLRIETKFILRNKQITYALHPPKKLFVSRYPFEEPVAKGNWSKGMEPLRMSADEKVLRRKPFLARSSHLCHSFSPSLECFIPNKFLVQRHAFGSSSFMYCQLLRREKRGKTSQANAFQYLRGNKTTKAGCRISWIHPP